LASKTVRNYNAKSGGYPMEANESNVQNIIDVVARIEKEVAKHMVGQKELIRQVVICILSGGNILLEGVPGLGKTRLVKTLGRVMDLQFSRIQFTPDLMPADVVGTNIIVKSENSTELPLLLDFLFPAAPSFITCFVIIVNCCSFFKNSLSNNSLIF